MTTLMARLLAHFGLYALSPTEWDLIRVYRRAGLLGFTMEAKEKLSDWGRKAFTDLQTLHHWGQPGEGDSSG